MNGWLVFLIVFIVMVFVGLIGYFFYKKRQEQKLQAALNRNSGPGHQTLY
jgi:LPXTG-motif cell wall-anchored protein